MKQSFLIPSLISLISFGANAQKVFSDMEYLDVNQIKASHMLHGDQWYNPSSGLPSCEYPQGTGKHANYAGGLWMGGYDGSGILKGAATLFRSGGIDFYPGPIDIATGACSHASSESWARIWKINYSDIKTFQTLSVKTVGTVPPVILEWPAKGNIYAKGYGGASLTITTDMAPFIDADGDGIYNALNGDYPKMKGDQMLWWVFNDNTGTHTLSKSAPIGVDVYAMAYAYRRVSSVDRMLFYEYTINNRSSASLDSFAMSFWDDADLGAPTDDQLAVDSMRRMVIEFQQVDDRPNGVNSYGKNPPITAVSIVEMPGDNYPSAMQKIGGVGFFTSSAVGKMRDPRSMPEFYNYMTGSDADGNPIALKDATQTYIYDINDPDICTPKFLTDRRFLLSTKVMHLGAGSSNKVGIVFAVTDTNAQVCPSLKLNEIKELMDTAWKVYYNPLPLSTKEISVAEHKLRIFPNPANSVLFIESANSKLPATNQLRIIDATGRTIHVPLTQSGNTIQINITPLAAGIYSLLYNDGDKTESQTFVKQ